METKEQIMNLVEKLNKFRDAYYNNNTSLVSDSEYDKLFDRLKELEETTGIILPNSPTITVGFEVKSELTKVRHNHPMLSLAKTHSTEDVVNMFGGRKALAMLKMDGLTVSLRYANGKLVSAETRGDGEIGEDVLHNIKVINNIPKSIAQKEELIIDGEVIIDKANFDRVNKNLSPDLKYKNQRNLAAGSLRQQDSSVAAKRGIKFIAWKVVKGFETENSFYKKLDKIQAIGFTVVPRLYYKAEDLKNVQIIDDDIQTLRNYAEKIGFPIDGIVFSYDDIAYGESLGVTGHYPKNQIAYKFANETKTTILRRVRWQMGKTGQLTPVAEFDPVELYGTTVSSASLHNISIMKELHIVVGKEIEVTKANEIIPQVVSCQSDTWDFKYPDTCPVCGGETLKVLTDSAEVLLCINRNCKGKLLGKLKHFVSRKGMDVNGLSEARLKLFMSKGWVNKLSDLYTLKDHKEEIAKLDKMGDKSTEKLLVAIEESKNCTVDKFLCALSIDGIGSSQSKWLSKAFDNSKDKMLSYIAGKSDYTFIDGIGEVLSDNINMYMENNWIEVQTLVELLNFPDEEVSFKEAKESNNVLEGQMFVITGSVHLFKNRDEIKQRIEELGGKVTGSVTKRTDYLICNEASNTGKYKKAIELGVPVVTEEDFVAFVNGRLDGE